LFKYGDKYTYGVFNGNSQKIDVTCPRHGLKIQSARAHLVRDGCETCSDETLFLKKAKTKFGDKFQYGVYHGSRSPIDIICPEHGKLIMFPLNHLKRDGCAKCTEAKRFLENARMRHRDRYEYGVYIDEKTPIEIICPDHGKCIMLPKNHLLSNKGCSNCAEFKPRKTTKQYINEARKIHGDKFEYGQYTHIKAPIDIYCPLHGKFTTSADGHLRGSGCPSCAGNVKLHVSDFIRRGDQLFNNKYDYSKTSFIGMKDIVVITCPIHGDFEIVARNHLKGAGCKACSNKEKLTFDRFVECSKKVHGDNYIYHVDSFENSLSKVRITCKIHGDFYQLVSNHMHARHGCPKCTSIISRPEVEYLDSLGLPNDVAHRQVRLKVEGTKKGYIVDGFDPLTNTVYEFDGDFWHGNPAIYNQDDMHPRAKMTFGQLYVKTMERKEKLRQAGYKVVSIWESEWKSRVD
jgi:hypothetical protein